MGFNRLEYVSYINTNLLFVKYLALRRINSTRFIEMEVVSHQRLLSFQMIWPQFQQMEISSIRIII